MVAAVVSAVASGIATAALATWMCAKARRREAERLARVYELAAYRNEDVIRAIAEALGGNSNHQARQ